jgi:hypothetical protein
VSNCRGWWWSIGDQRHNVDFDEFSPVQLIRAAKGVGSWVRTFDVTDFD